MTEEQAPYDHEKKMAEHFNQMEEKIQTLKPGSVSVVSNPNGLIMAAINQNADVAVLERLLALQERWEANEAKKAFVRAMAEFKATAPRIAKDRTADFPTKTGGRMKYLFANLADVAATVGPPLSKCGLNASWRTEQNGKIVVTCVLTHEQGHSETCTLSADADTTGSKNPIQAIGSTISYLERYTLLSILGLASEEMDDDGHAAGGEATINEAQADDLKKRLGQVNADTSKFLKYFGIEKIELLPESRLKEAIAKIAAKAKKEG